MPLKPEIWSDFAKSHLMNLQYLALINNGFDPENFSKNIQENMSKVQRNVIEKITDSKIDFENMFLEAESKRIYDVPTPYEFPPYYAILLSLSEIIESQLNLDSRIIKPIIGTINSGRMHAECSFFWQTKEYMILIEAGLPGFINIMSKIFTEILILDVIDGEAKFAVSGPVNIDDHLKDKFLECVISYLVFGDPLNAKQYFPRKEIREFSGNLTTATEMFIISHEYGHIACNHIGEHGTTDDGWRKFSTYKPWGEEFEADKYGLNLCGSSLASVGINPNASIMGSTFFFACDEIINLSTMFLQYGPEWKSFYLDRINSIKKSIAEKGEGSHELGTHPPSDLRRKLLAMAFNEPSSGGGAERFERSKALFLSERICEVTKKLIDISFPFFLDLHERGYRPKPHWTSTC